MSFKLIKANPQSESGDLSMMQHRVLPGEPEFGNDVWLAENVRSFWITANDIKVGIVCIELNAEPGMSYSDDSTTVSGSVYLLLIGLLPEWQEQGLGKRAMKSLKEFCAKNGYHRIASNLRPSNTASRRLHEGSGFKEIALRPLYYSNPDEDSIVLEFLI